jgi:DNA ligase 1
VTPMLAKRAVLSKLRYPWAATPKVDGIRCLKLGGRALSRSGKPIANGHIRELIETSLPDGVDGELVSGSFSDTQSAVMSHGGQPAFRYLLFDLVLQLPYRDRLAVLRYQQLPSWCEVLHAVLVCSEQELLAYEAHQLSLGREGVVLRDVQAHYTPGRTSTMLKLKRFRSGEAVVVGAVEERAVRTRAPKGALGALVVRCGSAVFEIGTGFTREQREQLWRHPPIGATVHFRYQAPLPRHPVFVGIRRD